MDAEKEIKNVICPQCKKKFILCWDDYYYDEKTKQYETRDCALIIHSCPSGGIYMVAIKCPYCGYEEEL